MKRRLIIVLMLWICFILQTTVFSAFSFLAATPNLMMIFTVAIGFMQGRTEGLLTGFLCGLLYDLFYGDVFGIYAFLYMVCGYFSGRFSKIYFDEDVKVPLLLVAGCEFGFNVVVYAANFLLRGRLNFTGYLKSIIIPDVVATLLCTIILYRLFYKVNHTLTEKEKKGKQSLWIRD